MREAVPPLSLSSASQKEHDQETRLACGYFSSPLAPRRTDLSEDGKAARSGLLASAPACPHREEPANCTSLAREPFRRFIRRRARREEGKRAPRRGFRAAPGGDPRIRRHGDQAEQHGRKFEAYGQREAALRGQTFLALSGFRPYRESLPHGL